MISTRRGISISWSTSMFPRVVVPPEEAPSAEGKPLTGVSSLTPISSSGGFPYLLVNTISQGWIKNSRESQSIQVGRDNTHLRLNSLTSHEPMLFSSCEAFVFFAHLLVLQFAILHHHLLHLPQKPSSQLGGQFCWVALLCTFRVHA